MSGSLEVCTNVTIIFECFDFGGCFPVTGLKEFWLGASNFLLQGQGPFVSVVDVESGKLIQKTKVFRRNNVYGFMIDEVRCQEQGRVSVLVWGGSSLRIIDIHRQRDDGDLRIVCGSLEHAAPDWIYDICPAHIGDSGSLAYLVTGHNSVLSINAKRTVNSKYPNKIQLRHLLAGVKSTLYSANILALSASHILVAAGTVFGEIIVWSCFISKHDSQSLYSSSIHHFFTGHEGSIFGVNISGELPLTEGKSGRLLASCSDDRTVRIWNISDCFYATSADQAAYATDGFDLRSTGFGSTAPAKMSSGSESAVAKCWGHAARVWGVYFLPIRAEYPNVVNLVSRGEDATSLLWRLDLTGAHQFNGDMKLDLTNISTLSHHAGKHIWSLALSEGDKDTKLLYTGGNDGTVRTYELTFLGKDGNNGEEPSIKISPYSPKTLLKAARAKIDHDGFVPRFFAFVSSNTFIITYASGLVQLGTLLTTSHNPNQAAAAKPEISWEDLAVAEDLSSSSCISALPRHGLAVIGGSTGILRLYNHTTKTLTELTKVSSRPVKIVMLDADFNASKVGHSFRFLVAYPRSKNAELFDFETAGSGSSYTIRKTELICPPYIAITTGSIVCHGRYLAVGGKSGQILFYKLDARKECLECSFIEHRLHGKASVTFLSPIEDVEDPNEGYVLTGGRDGNYCVYRLHCYPDRDVTPRDFQIVHRSVAFLSQVEGAYFDQKTGHFMVFGFRGNFLILWDETTQTDILALDCGGVHRVWEFTPDPDALGACTIIWIQARALHVLVAGSAVHRPLQMGTHGREIKSLAIARTQTGNGRNLSRASPLIASGGEDTLIHISTRSRDKDSMWNPVRCLHVMGDHVSGLQRIKWSDDGRFLFSSACREEFFVWRIRSVPKFGLATLMEAACPREEFETELRIMSFDVLRMQSAADEDRFLLALVYSNSTIKVFSYTSSAETHAFELLGRGTYSTNCLTEVHFVGDSDSNFALVTGATDGYIAFWPLQWITHSRIDGYTTIASASATTSVPTVHSIEWKTHHAIHTSSIKSLEVEEISPGFQVLVGGGDDNSLSVTLVRLDTVVRVVSSMSVSNAHASAVTAVRILHSSVSSEEGRGTAILSVASAGNDQCVKLWSVTVGLAQNQAIGISLVSVRYCPVADVAAMDIMEVGDSPTVDRVLVIGGVGLEMVPVPWH
ncbi:hypothetical protein UA08_08197 [Talaromyces atroroseus]|uniref:Uncharacterized protein n=1 Tax=Talaromyces atroroseus TaxID=1441469 RepID=A0A225ACL4_TALAT|nr:hypothetical protein UA08_08197 [Talaromyces atroroseus]OKL56633.1 hypothetical protein UA08_08197 [Talaromyces atroroseus]